MWNRLKKNPDSVILTIVGIISVILGILNVHKPERITLFLLGVICISISIERFVKLENIEKDLNELKRRIETVVPVEIIEGKDRVYESAKEIVKDAKSFIRATSLSEQATAPEDYLKTVAGKLKESKDQGNPIEYRIVMSSGKKNEDKQWRSEIFNEYGVSKLVNSVDVDITWGMDVLIVDNKHLLIAFPELITDKSLRRGILFKNNSELVNSIREWYDNYLWKLKEK